MRRIKGAVPPETSDRLLRALDELYADTDAASRATFRILGTDGVCRRDAVHMHIPDEDRRVAVYRIARTNRTRDADKLHFRSVALPAAAPPIFAEAVHAIAEAHGLPKANHLVVHRYLDGSDNIGPHHDKVVDMAEGAPIGTLSIGCTRTFQVKRRGRRSGAEEAISEPTESVNTPLQKRTRHPPPPRARAPLSQSVWRVAKSWAMEHGDAVVVPFAANLVYKHGVPPTSRRVGVRYSITFRCMRTFYDPAARVFVTQSGRRVPVSAPELTP